MEQRTQEWHNIRLGKVTASRISDVMAKTKSGYSTSRDNYMKQLIVERLTQSQEDGYTSAEMQRGIDLETTAKAAYTLETGIDITDIGFIHHPTINMSGASPDGLICDDGLIEIKCPKKTTHYETIQKGKIKREYLLQMQWQMACTGRQWCDFVSFDDRFPEYLQLYIKRVERDNELIAEIEQEVIKFLDEIEQHITETTHAT